MPKVGWPRLGLVAVCALNSPSSSGFRFKGFLRGRVTPRISVQCDQEGTVPVSLLKTAQAVPVVPLVPGNKCGFLRFSVPVDSGAILQKGRQSRSLSGNPFLASDCCHFPDKIVRGIAPFFPKCFECWSAERRLFRSGVLFRNLISCFMVSMVFVVPRNAGTHSI